MLGHYEQSAGLIFLVAPVGKYSEFRKFSFLAALCKETQLLVDLSESVLNGYCCKSQK